MSLISNSGCIISLYKLKKGEEKTLIYLVDDVCIVGLYCTGPSTMRMCNNICV